MTKTHEFSDYVARLELTPAEQADLYVLAKYRNTSIDALIAQLVRAELAKSA